MFLFARETISVVLLDLYDVLIWIHVFFENCARSSIFLSILSNGFEGIILEGSIRKLCFFMHIGIGTTYIFWCWCELRIIWQWFCNRKSAQPRDDDIALCSIFLMINFLHSEFSILTRHRTGINQHFVLPLRPSSPQKSEIIFNTTQKIDHTLLLISSRCA